MYEHYTAGKVSKYEVISSPYFPVFGLNTEIFSVVSVFGPNTGKYGPEITPYLDTFYTVSKNIVLQLSPEYSQGNVIWMSKVVQNSQTFKR